MMGVEDPPANRGIIPRAFDHIFDHIAVSEGTRYLLTASYLEIYNEEVRDLLGRDVKKRLELHEHPEKGVYVQDLSSHKVCRVSLIVRKHLVVVAPVFESHYCVLSKTLFCCRCTMPRT